MPSEHIPALMERVKPIYLSRTYDISLPDPHGPTRGWDPEQFLNTLAKMKGRLLKGGEPDVDGVAKIILTDWVRGRIPFFVPPPERPEELNNVGTKSEAKGKAKTMEEKEEKEIVSVKQNLNSLIRKNTFLAEDMRPLLMGGETGTNEEALSNEGSPGEKQGTSEHASDDGDLSWNDVFEEGDRNVDSSFSNTAMQSTKGRLTCDASSLLISSLAGDVSSDEEPPAPPKKETRMKTSKVLGFSSRIPVTFTPAAEKSHEFLHECECEEQKSRQGGATQVVTSWQERRGSEASRRLADHSGHALPYSH